jgi:hypothetical protein
VWHALGHSVAADRPTLGELLVDIHKYNELEEPIELPPVYMPIAPGTLDPIKEEQQTQLLIWLDSPIDNEQRQENDSSSNKSESSSNKTESNTIDQSIRNSPITITHLLSMATQMQQVTQTTTGSSRSGSAAVIGTAITMATQQQIQSSLARAMGQSGPLGGGLGGPSRSGGSGPPAAPGRGAPGRGGSLGARGPPSGPPAPKPAPVPAAPATPIAAQPVDKRPVGDLPTMFTGRREDAEQFINEIEGYFLLNQNIP